MTTTTIERDVTQSKLLDLPLEVLLQLINQLTAQDQICLGLTYHRLNYLILQVCGKENLNQLMPTRSNPDDPDPEVTTIIERMRLVHQLRTWMPEEYRLYRRCKVKFVVRQERYGLAWLWVESKNCSTCEGWSPIRESFQIGHEWK